jgi:glycosyltransferase involved in cell wall biosynthesis
MTILFICDEYPPEIIGGIGRYIETAVKLLAKGENVKVFVAGLYSYNSEELRDGVRIFRFKNLKVPSALFILNRFWFSWLIRRFVRKFGIQVIESGDYGATIIPQLIPAPVICRFHGNHITVHSVLRKSKINIRFLRDLFLYNLIKSSAALTFGSQYIACLAQKHLSVSIEKVRLIYYPIDVSLFRPLGIIKNKNILFVGTLSDKKGVFELMQAVLPFLYDHPDYQASFYGKDGFDKDRAGYVGALLKKMVPHELVKRIIIAPHLTTPDLINKYNEAALCCFPSKWESFGLMVGEAMSSGAIVLTYDFGPMPEIINDGVDGFLSPYMDVKMLETNIRKIISMSEDDKKRVAYNARNKIVGKFSSEIWRNDSLDHYRSIIKLFQ